MKETRLEITNLFAEEQAEILVLSKSAAVRLIQDLAEDLGCTGAGGLVLRTQDNRFITFKVRE